MGPKCHPKEPYKRKAEGDLTQRKGNVGMEQREDQRPTVLVLQIDEEA